MGSFQEALKKLVEAHEGELKKANAATQKAKEELDRLRAKYDPEVAAVEIPPGVVVDTAMAIVPPLRHAWSRQGSKNTLSLQCFKKRKEGFDGHDQDVLNVDRIASALPKRWDKKSIDMSKEDVRSALEELNRLRPRAEPPLRQQGTDEYNIKTMLAVLKELNLESNESPVWTGTPLTPCWPCSRTSNRSRTNVMELHKRLLTESSIISDVVATKVQNVKKKLAKKQPRRSPTSRKDENQLTSEESSAWTPPRRHYELVSTAASVAVVVSCLVMGLSADVKPGHWVWTLVEAICALVFLAEVWLKAELLHGFKKYITDKQDKVWHWLDVVITVMSILDVMISMVVALTNWKEVGELASKGKVVIAVRLLRVARVMRLIKLLRTPGLQSVANMLGGVLIGLPALLSVLVVLFMVVYVMAVLFRMVLGPDNNDPYSHLMRTCGKPEDVPQNFTDGRIEPECVERLHEVYGEAYFGSVPQAMFTMFRCMIGDCTTEPGGSLAVYMSAGFGIKFYIIYCVGMIAITFGLFNIITAVFVDSTILGLKQVTARRKLQQYEGESVEKNLHKLLVYIEREHIGEWERLPEDDGADDGSPGTRIGLDIDQIVVIMQDPNVKDILQELDVDLSNLNRDAFSDGFVSVSELVDGILKIRGEPLKNEMSNLNTKVDNIARRLEEIADRKLDDRGLEQTLSRTQIMPALPVA